MTFERTPGDPNDRGDAAFVARVAGAYAPPAMTPAQRARFDARLTERVTRDRLRFVPWLAAGAAAAAAALFVLSHLSEAPGSAPARIAQAPAPDSGVVLSEAFGSAGDFEETLPPEYQAIASLLGEL